jgi:8-oxo-dGTP pyrophosphatase MutT (NUDIX family)
MQRDVVLLILFDQEGRFLLQHRDETAPTYGGYWGFFGGGVEDGEKPEKAIQREAFEELRYSPLNLVPRLVISYRDEKLNRHGTKYYFSELCPCKSGLELHEGQGMGWFSLSESANLKMTSSNRSILEKLATQI